MWSHSIAHIYMHIAPRSLKDVLQHVCNLQPLWLLTQSVPKKVWYNIFTATTAILSFYVNGVQHRGVWVCVMEYQDHHGNVWKIVSRIETNSVSGVRTWPVCIDLNVSVWNEMRCFQRYFTSIMLYWETFMQIKWSPHKEKYSNAPCKVARKGLKVLQNTDTFGSGECWRAKMRDENINKAGVSWFTASYYV